MFLLSFTVAVAVVTLQVSCTYHLSTLPVSAITSSQTSIVQAVKL